MKNFTKHANRVGYITASVDVIWTWLNSVPGSVFIDEDGCLHSESFPQ